jgi:hypothetical protein
MEQLIMEGSQFYFRSVVVSNRMDDISAVARRECRRKEGWSYVEDETLWDKCDQDA